MALSISSLTSSLSSLSFSSQISRNPSSISIPQPPKTLPISLSSKPTRSLSISATVAAPVESEPVENLKKYVKSRLPGGFAAQTIIGTGRRKCAIARVVLQEGTGKLIINYRDAKVKNWTIQFLGVCVTDKLAVFKMFDKMFVLGQIEL